jgi:RNA polymerase sigma-70 factor, ECF subfamily
VAAPPVRDITGLLTAWRGGDQSALDELFPIVYAELRHLAHAQMRREGPGRLLQTTALVHEAYLRLVDACPTDNPIVWQNRHHFFVVAAKVMRRVLVDEARARGAHKRGGNARQVPFDETMAATPERDADLIALDDALTALAALDARKEQVVELRYFAGLGVEETAAVLHVSTDTVTRDWKAARLWLLRELDEGRPASGAE